MFKYVTTSFINGASYVNGEPSWLVVEDGTCTSTSDPEFKDFEDEDLLETGANADLDSSTFVLVNRNVRFVKGTVTRVSKAKWVIEKPALATIDASSLEEGDYQAFFYIGSNGNANPLYSNDSKSKARPFGFEFSIKAADLGKEGEKIAKTAKKWLTLSWDNGPILKFSGDESNLTIKALDEYQTFDKIVISKLEPDALGWAVAEGFKPVITYDPSFGTLEDGVITSEDGFVEVTLGNPGQGTYKQLIKDLRLPTNAAWHNQHPLQQFEMDEVPLVTGKYWQYTIDMCTERPEMQGTSVLGQYNKSLTQHVLFVEENMQEAFEEAISVVFPVEETATTQEIDDASFPAVETAGGNAGGGTGGTTEP